jgi:dethiobiotin synthetase
MKQNQAIESKHQYTYQVNCMQDSANKTIFVTGTDTSVGKTYLCARLLEFLQKKGIRAGYQKWVATGVTADLPEDLVLCLAAAGISPAPEHIHRYNPYAFRFPASPHLAAEMENRTVLPEVIVENYKILAARHEWIIVEGVGGILVPLQRQLLLADLVARMQLRTLIVARSGLGTLNHTLLTLEALRVRQIPVLGVVFSDSGEKDDKRLIQDNMQTIEQMGRVRVFGRLPRLGNEAEAAAAFIPVGQAIWDQLHQSTS